MRWRYLPFYILLIFFTWLLAARLFDLTIIKGVYYRGLSEGNRVGEKLIRAPRGVIYDRLGQVLARNVPTYKFKVQPFDFAQGKSSKFKIIGSEEALTIQAQGGSEAAKLQMDLGREYPYGSLFAHVLGFTGEVNEDEVSKDYKVYKNYKSGDFIGRTGVEEQYEKILRGTDGKEMTETDALGRSVRSLGRIEPIPGKNLTLSLDLNLQKAAAKEMEGKTGAVVVSNPQNGEILALYSSPSFDPGNIGDLSNLGNLGDQPLFNRAIAGLYPPGSTFKIITAAAGLETGKINKDTQIEDTGEINIGPFKFPNWYFLQYGGKEGLVDIVKAIKRSNDTFFYKVGEIVGIEELEIWAKKFGLGRALGIDLPGEAAGRIRLLRDWYLGDTYHTAIGQGDLEVTPLQMNFWTNVIANGGKFCKPHLTQDTSVEGSGKNCKDIGLHKETIDLITEGMKEACSTGGTGWPFFNFQLPMTKTITVACKTGTAEYGDPKGKTHAWFTVFAPAYAEATAGKPVDQPEISVTVLVEGGGEGSNVAAPIAKKILEEWFGR